jgi:NAD(P)-dependent dehydrogenase (short-subunit alcohol dehydrogenase family)
MGVGWCLAREFLGYGDSVVICSSNSTNVSSALNALKTYKHPGSILDGIVVDVAEPNDVERLKSHIENVLGGVDHWINAAGKVTRNAPLYDVQPEDIILTARANLIGPLLCGRAAARIMMQKTELRSKIFHIWNFGFSTFGRVLSRSAATHKSTKTGLSALTAAMREEFSSYPAIAVHQCSPGLVLTNLLLDGAKDSIASKYIFNALALEPYEAAKKLCQLMRDSDGSDEAIELLTPSDALGKLFNELPNILLRRGGRYFDANGRRIESPNRSYDTNGVEKLY